MPEVSGGILRPWHYEIVSWLRGTGGSFLTNRKRKGAFPVMMWAILWGFRCPFGSNRIIFLSMSICWWCHDNNCTSVPHTRLTSSLTYIFTLYFTNSNDLLRNLTTCNNTYIMKVKALQRCDLSLWRIHYSVVKFEVMLLWCTEVHSFRQPPQNDWINFDSLVGHRSYGPVCIPRR